jgi:hypothetical protein
MDMKLLFFTIILILSISGTSAQTFSGKVVDNSNKPLAYVNIGIIGKNIGTVSGEKGAFNLTIPDSLQNGKVRFSMIGLTTLEFSIEEFKKKCAGNGIFMMQEETFALKEIVIVPKTYITKIVGNKTTSKTISAGFRNNLLGHELGVLMKIKKRPAKINSVSFYFNQCIYDTIFYRLNVYEMAGKEPGRNIMPAPYYLNYTKDQLGELLTIDLAALQLWVEDDFLVTLEIVKDLGEGGIMFSAGLFNSPTYFRVTSQGTWESIPVGIGISAEISQEK